MTKLPKRFALYLRISSRDQSFASQEYTVRDYCRRQGWKNLRAFREKKTGLKSLPVLGQLLQAVRDGAIACIVVFKLDRLGRSPVHTWLILEEMEKRRVGVISVTENFDTSDSNPMAKAVMQIGSVWAGLFSAQLSDRVRAGQAAAKKRGGKGPGRPGISAEKEKEIRALLINPPPQPPKTPGAGRPLQLVSHVAKLAGVSRPIVDNIKKSMEAKK